MLELSFGQKVDLAKRAISEVLAGNGVTASPKDLVVLASENRFLHRVPNTTQVLSVTIRESGHTPDGNILVAVYTSPHEIKPSVGKPTFLEIPLVQAKAVAAAG